MRVLCLYENIFLKEIINLTLKADFDGDFFFTHSSGDLEKQIAEIGGPHIILADYEKEAENIIAAYSYIKKNDLNIPLIVISDHDIISEHDIFGRFQDEHQFNVVLPKNFDPDELSVLIGLAMSGVTKRDFCEFFKVDIESVKRFERLNVDVFIKINEIKYVKVIKTNQPYDQNTLKNYMDKGIEYLYIKREDFKIFYDFFVADILKSLSDESKSLDDKIDDEMDAVVIVHTTLQNFHIDKKTIEVIDNVNESIIKNLEKEQSLKKIFAKILQVENFNYQFDLLVSYISNAIAMEMEWNTRETLKKLSCAAFLQDISLQDEKILKDHHFIDMNQKNEFLSPLEKEEVIDHPRKSAEIAQGLTDLPPDVDTIILCHHEKPDGSGYPRSLQASAIPVLGCIFILAEEMAVLSWKVQGDLKKYSDLEKDLKDRYNFGNFKKPLEALLKIIKN